MFRGRMEEGIKLFSACLLLSSADSIKYLHILYEGEIEEIVWGDMTNKIG